MAAIAIPQLPRCSYFFQQLARAGQGVLVIDYDSAVVRFGPLREWRFPCPTIHEILDSILSTTRTRVVIVSKRRTRELERVLGASADRVDQWANLQLITLNGTYHQCTPQSLLANLAALGPLAYLAGPDGHEQASALRGDAPLENLLKECWKNSLHEAQSAPVQPLFFLDETKSWIGEPEDVVQFLIDWLRACGGELC